MIYHFRLRDLLRYIVVEAWHRCRALRAGVRGDSQALRRDRERRRNMYGS